VPVADDNPLPVIAAPSESVSVLSTASGAVFSSGQSIGGSIPISGGFIVGATIASLRHLRVAVAGSQTANITATILSGAVSTASTIANGSAAAIAAVDAGKIIGQEVLAPVIAPGGSATVYRQTGLDYVVPNGGQVVLTPSATVTVAASSGVTVGAGLA
jgi:hypothetical protein